MTQLIIRETAFSVILFVSSSKTSRNREVIIARYDAILDQSDRALSCNHLSSYTNISYLIFTLLSQGSSRVKTHPICLCSKPKYRPSFAGYINIFSYFLAYLVCFTVYLNLRYVCKRFRIDSELKRLRFAKDSE